jgi:hypothetical protein
MIERTFLRLMIGVGVPIVTVVVMEQLPKTGVVEVPFAFQVEKQTLPPGIYSVKQADRGRGIRIQNEKVAQAGLKCIAAKHKFGNAQEPKLVFDSYQGRYMLSEIWFDANGRGLVLRDASLRNQAGPTPQDRDVRSVSFR